MKSRSSEIDKLILQGGLDNDSPLHLVVNGADEAVVFARTWHLVSIGVVDVMSDATRTVYPLEALTEALLFSGYDVIYARNARTLDYLNQNIWVR